MNAILLPKAMRPRVLAAYTHVLTIEEEDWCIFDFFRVETVTLLLVIAIVQLLGIEVDGHCIEWRAALHLQAQACGIGLCFHQRISLLVPLSCGRSVWEVLVVGIICLNTAIRMQSLRSE